ncbi:hypothetical protein C8R43DRAFT_951979 [Mycena crocata]|nr:hypothetical protein C8R43DRAFT_951979 [Mycena crocata]
MPSHPTLTRIRLNNIIIGLTGIANTLEVLSEALTAPFLEPISRTSRSLLNAVQTIKQNKNDCAHLMEQTICLLYAIVSVHVKSTTGPDLPPSTLNHLGKFTETLHKVHTYVEAQQDKRTIQQFFHQGEMSMLLKACNTGLQEALHVFEKYTEDCHQEVLHLIETLSYDSMSDRESLRILSNLNNSSSSISMLPSEPKIFHGRESELSDILTHFALHTPRIAILGPGGIGKTSLARAILHELQITNKFEQFRFFVTCDSASTKAELVALIGAHLGLRPGKDLTGLIIHFFSSKPACLLILDNLETLWEPMETRHTIEHFLSLLTDVPTLALLVG